MKTFKQLKDNKIELAGVTYRPYFIGDLPNHFGCIGFERDEKGDIVRYGISEWFSYKGLCYIKDKR